ncbi:MAG: LytR C-terminal domain-containing protein [Patescibacteria group bacterium]
MPEEENKVEDIEGKTPVEEVNDEGKKRIKPVIEEVVPGNAEAKESTPEIIKEHEEHHEHHEHFEHHEPVQVEAPPINLEESKSDIKLFIFVAIITALVVAALAGGIYVYLNGINNLNNPAPSPTATPIVEETSVPSPTASSAAEVKLSTYKVQILNGSGKIGEANKAKALLEKAGFEIKSTANAATFDFTDTIIESKSTVSETAVAAAKEALSKTYSVEIGDALPASSAYDIVITVGSK